MDNFNYDDDGCEYIFDDMDFSILNEKGPKSLINPDHSDYQPGNLSYLFTYGTMKRGFRNHKRLVGGKFVRNASTIYMYDLVARVTSKGQIAPAAIPGTHSILGEIYQIDGPVLLEIDLAEGVPNVYTRNLIKLKDYPGKVWIYTFGEFMTKDLDNTNLIVRTADTVEFINV